MTRIFICWILAFSMLFYGINCTHTDIFSPEHLLNDAGRDITVHTNDGRMIQFRAGSYSVSGENFGTLRGTGRMVIDQEKREYRAFEGTLYFNEIREIRATRATVLGTAAALGLVALGIILVILIVSPPHIDID